MEAGQAILLRIPSTSSSSQPTSPCLPSTSLSSPNPVLVHFRPPGVPWRRQTKALGVGKPTCRVRQRGAAAGCAGASVLNLPLPRLLFPSTLRAMLWRCLCWLSVLAVAMLSPLAGCPVLPLLAGWPVLCCVSWLVVLSLLYLRFPSVLSRPPCLRSLCTCICYTNRL